MSGVPVYTQSPITASKAQGSTPQTTGPPTHTTTGIPPTNTATTTATASLPTPASQYPNAQPGTLAAPAPTAAAQRYAPLEPTPTTKAQDGGPPAPQPGAAPVPPNSSVRSYRPPPPKAGETLASTAVPKPQPYPPQMAIPPPTTLLGAHPPSSSTIATTTSSAPYPVALPPDASTQPRSSLEHPPGYVQNPYAADLTPDQRRAQEEAERQNESSFGGAENLGSTAPFGVDSDSVWSTAKKWAQTAGEKISEAETEIWKRVNKEQ